MSPRGRKRRQSDPDQRAAERIDVLGELRGEITIIQSLVVTELAHGGLQIETTFPLKLGSLHQFRLTLGTTTVVVQGRVVHCTLVDIEHEDVRYRAGVELVDPSAQATAAIDRFIESLKIGRATPTAP